MDDTNNHKKCQNLKEEQNWWLEKNYINSGHWTSNKIFASRHRHWIFGRTDKIRFYSYYEQYLNNFMSLNDNRDKALFAPVGDGKDYYFVKNFFKDIHGIDCSDYALKLCPNPIIKKQGDILHTGYDDKYFDSVLCVNFLHHVHKIGFDPFIEEFFRILKPGGVLAILEPSSLSPWYWITSSLRKILGNVTGLVPDEAPFIPGKLSKKLNKAGYIDMKIIATNFGHPRFPAFLQHLTYAVDYPFRVLWPFKNFAHGIGWYCRKPINIKISTIY